MMVIAVTKEREDLDTSRVQKQFVAFSTDEVGEMDLEERQLLFEAIFAGGTLHVLPQSR